MYPRWWNSRRGPRADARKVAALLRAIVRAHGQAPSAGTDIRAAARRERRRWIGAWRSR